MASSKQKSIKIRKHNLIQTRRENVFKDWKLKICKWMRIPVLHRYQFIYQVEYYSGKIQKGDVLINLQGVAFAVMSAGQGMATIMSHDPKSEQPRMTGAFGIIDSKQYDKKENETKTDKK